MQVRRAGSTMAPAVTRARARPMKALVRREQEPGPMAQAIPRKVRLVRQAEAPERPGQVGSTPERQAEAPQRRGRVGSRRVPALAQPGRERVRPTRALATGPGRRVLAEGRTEAVHPMRVPAIGLNQRQQAPQAKRAIPMRAQHSVPHPRQASVRRRAMRQVRKGTPTSAGSTAPPRTDPSSGRAEQQRWAPLGRLGRRLTGAPMSKRLPPIVEVRQPLAGLARRGGWPDRLSCA
jgi:hypothetical protein